MRGAICARMSAENQSADSAAERDSRQVVERAVRELEAVLKRKPTDEEIGFVLRAALHPPGTPEVAKLRGVKVKEPEGDRPGILPG